MKTAIVLTGHLRFWKKVLPNFREYWLDRFQPDVFIHTWDTEGWWMSQGTGINPASDLLDTNGVREAYNPVSFVVENEAEIRPGLIQRAKPFVKGLGHPPGVNVVSMLYKLKAGVDLLEDHVGRTGTHYDLVIRMRPDVVMHQAPEDFDPTVLTTVYDRNHLLRGIGDMFQIGSLDNVVRFARIYTEIERIYAETNGLCPHVACEHWIRTQNIPWKEVRFHKSLQRLDGLNTQRHQPSK